MSVTNRITMVPFPDADRAFEFYHDQNSWFDIASPPGHGWHLENAFLGNNVIYFIWKHGSGRYDSGLMHYWSGYGDDVANNTYGDGQQLFIQNTIGSSASHVDVEFIHTDNYLYGGTVTTDLTSLGNYISIEFYANETIISENMYGNVIVDNGIVKPDDNGTHIITAYGLVPFENGDWDYNDVELIPNLGNGSYILNTTETLLSRPVNKIPITGLNGTSQEVIGGNGIKLIKGGFFRITTINNSNTDWKAYLYFHFSRNCTI